MGGLSLTRQTGPARLPPFLLLVFTALLQSMDMVILTVSSISNVSSEKLRQSWYRNFLAVPIGLTSLPTQQSSMQTEFAISQILVSKASFFDFFSSSSSMIQKPYRSFDLPISLSPMFTLRQYLLLFLIFFSFTSSVLTSSMLSVPSSCQLFSFGLFAIV